MNELVIDIIKIFTAGTVAFFVALAISSPVLRYLYAHKMWKKKAGKVGLGGGETPIFNQLHKDREVGIPRLGGVVIWVSTLIAVFVLWFLAHTAPGTVTEKLSFLSRNQTWLPLFTLVAAALVGMVDDLMQIDGTGTRTAQGLPLSARILLVLIIGFAGGLWFYAKLSPSPLSVPLFGHIDFGLWIIPLFAIVMLAVFSGGVIDGIDGLAGGIMATVFAAYATIAFFQNQIDLASLAAALSGATLGFLWFNIPPARFYMGESGMLGLTAALAVIAFLSDSVFELLIIALPLFIASASDIIQIVSKKVRGKKVFLVAPIHHHFEALGLPSYSITMRFWVVGVICAVIGTVIALMS